LAKKKVKRRDVFSVLEDFESGVQSALNRLLRQHSANSLDFSNLRIGDFYDSPNDGGYVSVIEVNTIPYTVLLGHDGGARLFRGRTKVFEKGGLSKRGRMTGRSIRGALRERVWECRYEDNASARALYDSCRQDHGDRRRQIKF
jgi:hypothetical protein